MPVDRDDLGKIVNRAWHAARQRTKGWSAETSGQLHKKRSEAWVDELAKGFLQEYGDVGHRVFWMGNCHNRQDFYRNEFLFDVTVARIDTVQSLERKPKDLRFIAGCEWIVESELDNRNSRQIVVDMSKLVMGASGNKMFIASQRPGDAEQQILQRCEKIAAHCYSKLYFCFVAHPTQWCGDNPATPRLHQWREGKGWHPLSVGCTERRDRLRTPVPTVA